MYFSTEMTERVLFTKHLDWFFSQKVDFLPWAFLSAVGKCWLAKDPPRSWLSTVALFCVRVGERNVQFSHVGTDCSQTTWFKSQLCCVTLDKLLHHSVPRVSYL